jgi:hypothetical protein
LQDGENRKLDRKKLPLPTQIHLLRAKKTSTAITTSTTSTTSTASTTSIDIFYAPFDSELNEQLCWGFGLQIPESPTSAITWGGKPLESIHSDDWVPVR